MPMSYVRSRLRGVVFLSALALTASSLTPFLTQAALAETPKPVQQHNSNAIWFENWFGLYNATLTVVAPNGAMTSLFSEKGTPVYELQTKEKELPDGVYRYQLTAASEEMMKVVNPINNGRDKDPQEAKPVPFLLNGYFFVDRGVIITPKDIDEAELNIKAD